MPSELHECHIALEFQLTPLVSRSPSMTLDPNSSPWVPPVPISTSRLTFEYVAFCRIRADRI